MELNDIKSDNAYNETYSSNTTNTSVDEGTKQSQTVTNLAVQNLDAYQLANGQTTEPKHSLKGKPENTEKSAVMEPWRKVCEFFEKKRDTIVLVAKVFLLIGFFVYFGFAVAHYVGDEGSWRLIGFTIFGICLLAWRYLKRTKIYEFWKSFTSSVSEAYSTGKRSTVIRW